MFLWQWIGKKSFFFQEIVSLDAKEIAFTVLNELPDVTELKKEDFEVGFHKLNHYLCRKDDSRYCGGGLEFEESNF